MSDRCWKWKHCYIVVVLLTCTYLWVPFQFITLVEVFQPKVHIFGQQQQSQGCADPQLQDDSLLFNLETNKKSCVWNGRTWKCQQCSIGRAAVASEALEWGYFRDGYDMALPLPTKFWKRDNDNNNNSMMTERRRPLLLQFRGVIQSTEQVGYHHRWLAGTYWEEADDVAVDVQCQEMHRNWRTKHLTVTKNYSFPSTVYRQWMEQSVYGFAPGGSGPGSYRFGEILYAGGIPVVTDNFVPPLVPEVDWSRCLIVVASYDDIVNLPALLRRQYSSNNQSLMIQQRQEACAALLRTVIGTSSEQESDNERVTFTKAMEIWYLRIKHALEYFDEMES